MKWGVLVVLLPTMSWAALAPEEQLVRDYVASYCEALADDVEAPPSDLNGIQAEFSPIERRGAVVGGRYLFSAENETLRLDKISPPGQPPRIIAERSEEGRPVFFIGTDPNCTVREIRRLHYLQRNGQFFAHEIERLGPWGNELGRELLNPEPLPAQAISNPRQAIRVAMVDSGVNYLLPEINNGLAVDHQGQMLGYDFWDLDDRPFDANTAASPFFVQRHGTRTASLLLRDAGPGVELVSYRYPRSNLQRMANLVRHADSLGIRIVGMPLGSSRLTDWIAFEQAARAHPHILFVASAGNGGRDIDAQPIYPAALDLDNLIVVSSAGDFTELAERVNFGAESVDYLLPAERQPALDFDGSERLVSGSSYAVSRMVAMLARLLTINPGRDAGTLKDAVADYVSPARDAGAVSVGYIADPRAPSQLIQFQSASAIEAAGLPVDIVILDSRWDISAIQSALAQASDILSQCEVQIGNTTSWQYSGPDYLRDLETGAAKTLLDSFSSQTGSTAIRLVFSRDTRMAMAFEAEAFGAGNTRTRPWLNNSLWIAHGAPDLGITIAHELFHILANDGRHLPGNDNLMSAETNGKNTTLTRSQCDQIQVTW